MRDAFWIDARGPAPLLLTCEHASARLPAPLEASAADLPWLDTHWAWDLGAEALVRRLLDRLPGRAVGARFSRLVCDPNRAPDHPDWIRESVEGHALSFNRGLDEAERRRRRRVFYEPYHQAIDDQIAATGRPTLVSVHSFTPVWEGRPRDTEVGVLFDAYEAEARTFAAALEEVGLVAHLNAPYSGLEGLIYAASRHGQGHDLTYLELEVRQDLLTDAASVARIADALEAPIRALAGL